MRQRLVAALALFACACGRGDRDDASSGARALPSSGPDPVVVRIPREGGIVRAFRYGNLDSLIWRSTQKSPPVERVLAFDAENGALAYLADNGVPGWLDLRLGVVRPGGKERLTSISSGDGYAIFGVSSSNALLRLTPSGSWSLPSKRRLRRLFPLVDGTLLLLADDGDRSMLLRIRPPDERIIDSVAVPRPDRAVATPIGDRVYLGARNELVGVRPGEMQNLERLTADDEILAITPTPSGDRVFVANKGGPQLEVVDRYAQRIESSVQLPGLVTDLRMDPMGRYLLARPVSGDSAWVVTIATQSLVGTVGTAWRNDLPTVTVDGMIAVARGDDVHFVDPNSGKTVREVTGGAEDIWFFMLWNGFRPRSQELDTPVSFATRDSSPNDRAAPDSSPPAVQPPRDSVPVPPTVVPAAPVQPAPVPAARDSWTVSFAAVLSEARAKEIAETINVDGQRPRVVAAQTEGTTVYRVVFGPYATKLDAERIGRASKHNYWVYEGVP